MPLTADYRDKVVNKLWAQPSIGLGSNFATTPLQSLVDTVLQIFMEDRQSFTAFDVTSTLRQAIPDSVRYIAHYPVQGVHESVLNLVSRTMDTYRPVKKYESRTIKLLSGLTALEYTPSDPISIPDPVTASSIPDPITAISIPDPVTAKVPKKRKSKTLRRFRAERYFGFLKAINFALEVEELSNVFDDSQEQAQEALDQLVRTGRIYRWQSDMDGKIYHQFGTKRDE